MRIGTMALALVAWAFMARAGWAFMLMDHPLEEKAQKSDTVIIGRFLDRPPVREEPKKEQEATKEYVWVRVENVLKGKPPREILVLIQQGIAEGDIKEPKAGTVAVLFLVDQHHDGKYYLPFFWHGVYFVPAGK